MPRLFSLLTSGVIALAATGIQSGKADAYPVDCAILLCLAGGWPASAECVHARAVFIRRITPWPIEPPLQIWNCPMRASFRSGERPMDRLLEIALRADTHTPLISVPEPAAEFLRVQDRADVDISDPVFDFVRSIHVFQIDYRRTRDKDATCSTSYSIRRGSYGEQGDFSWARTAPSAVPRASRFRPGTNCSNYRFRGVFVDWTDFEGTYGFEEVRY